MTVCLLPGRDRVAIIIVRGHLPRGTKPVVRRIRNAVCRVTMFQKDVLNKAKILVMGVQDIK